MTGRSPEHRKLIAWVDKQPEWKMGPLLNDLLRTNAGISKELSDRLYCDEVAAAEMAHLAKAG